MKRTKDLAFDAIGGLEVGAVPLTPAAVISYHQHGRAMEVLGSGRREGPRDKELVEGGLKDGTRVVVLDDVITKGTSPVKAIDAVHGMAMTWCWCSRW